MNYSKKGIIVIIFLALIGTIAKAQTNDFSHTVIVGIGSPILDNGQGFHLGYNPSLSVYEYLAVEGQLSYFYAETSGFINGRKDKVHSVNVLVGPRLYFTPQDKNIRPYINLLIGGLYTREITERAGISTTRSEFGLGFSGGAYVNIHQFVLGLSYDTPQNVIFKVGYTF